MLHQLIPNGRWEKWCGILGVITIFFKGPVSQFPQYLVLGVVSFEQLYMLYKGHLACNSGDSKKVGDLLADGWDFGFPQSWF